MNDSQREEPWLQIAVLMGAVGILLLALLSGRGVRLTQTYTSDDGTLSFRYLEGWTAGYRSGFYYVTNSPELLTSPPVTVLSPGQFAIAFLPSTIEDLLEPFYSLDNAERPSVALETVIAGAMGDFEFDSPVETRISGNDAASMKGTYEQGDVQLIFIDTQELAKSHSRNERD